jgi:cytochrome c553
MPGTLHLALAALTLAAPPDVEFFEKKIRPVLTEHCAKCHSADAQKANKLKGGLLLDTRAGLLAGGDSGPALVPGKPADSLLLQTLKYEGDVRMPPAGKLPDAVIADFERWIAAGAPDPRTGTAAKKQTGMSLEDGRNFWAYKPATDPPVPSVEDVGWSPQAIDRFTLAKLEAKGLAPAGDVDRATLIRRVYFDLIGLPPLPDEIDAFLADQSADAYEQLVHKLLASPAFGERWGRHWLDIARYAESVTLRGFVFKEAWRYRDYVIDSFNRDVPFDRFVREQIAGDLLPAATPADRARQLVATTYLMLGNTNLEEQDKKQLRMDVVDEQLDVITKGLLAQTVTCARCHDHKFDPIPTHDYYALAGILRNVKAMEHANVSAWTEVPLPVDEATAAALTAKEKQVAALQARIKAARGPNKGGVLAVAEVPGVVVDDTLAKKVGVWQDSTHNGTYVGAGYTHDQNAGKGEKTLTFAPSLPADGRYEVRFAYSPGANRAGNVPVTVFSADGEKTVELDMRKPPADGRFTTLGTFRFEKAGQSFVLVSNQGTTGHVTADCVTFVPVNAVGEPRQQKPAPNGGGELARLEAELKKLQAAGPHRPMVMAPVEEKVIEDCRVHVRGLVGNQGAVVPRGFLQVATAGKTAAIPAGQSGRVQLADWIASKDNPLTARVFVNRAWHWLFGGGLVRTVDNFGTTGEAPSHPELLDHLATRFVADGWSVKQLVRSLVLSRTYRQSSRPDPRSSSLDPENRLFGRANRRRLDAECIRDAMLAVSGQLDRSRGGQTFPPALASDYGYITDSRRRSVYLPAFRNALPDLLAAFDPADPSAVTGARSTGAVAPQALVLLNHPFVADQARHAAERVATAVSGEADRVRLAYRLALGREPTAGEQAAARRYLAAKPADPWAGLLHALFASADFRFVD